MEIVVILTAVIFAVIATGIRDWRILVPPRLFGGWRKRSRTQTDKPAKPEKERGPFRDPEYSPTDS